MSPQDQGPLGKRHSAQKSDGTTVIVCYHVIFYSGLGKTPYDAGMSKLQGCPQGLFVACLSKPPLGPADVWILTLCLQRMSLYLPSSGILGPAQSASGQLSSVQSPLLPLLPVCGYEMPSVKTVWSQHLPLPNSQTVTLEEVSPAGLSSIVDRKRGSPVPSWNQKPSQRQERGLTFLVHQQGIAFSDR